MALNQEQFDALVERLETFARKQPALYRFRVGLLAALGYAYIFFILAALLAVLGLIVLLVIFSQRINAGIIKIGFFVLILMFLVLRSLWVTFAPPTGLRLTRQDVPRLFALVDELTSKLQAPRFHHILLDDDFNAGVVQRPRLGLLGWQQNYLILGLPLMLALSPAQFRAVLAHELGHLSGNHNRFSGWIYRIQITYEQVFERLHQNGAHGSSWLFERFFNWYAPFFSAYSFVLRRMNEYEADRCAAELAGVQTTAEMLISVKVKARFLQSSFWPSIHKQVEHLVEPPATTYTSMLTAFRGGVTEDEAQIWLAEALREKTNHADTHPCLIDRLKALGCEPTSGKQLPIPAPLEVSAAREYLGGGLKKLAKHFDRNWQEQVATPWRQKYVYVQESLATLKTLDEKAQNQTLTTEEAWDRACFTWEFKGNEAATPLLQEILATQPNHVSANYGLGKILLDQNDSTGIDYIEKAIACDSEIVIEGCELIYYFLKQQGKNEEAQAYLQRAQKHYELLMLAQQERAGVSENDKFEPHDLLPKQVKPLRQQICTYPQVKEAYLVRKVVNYFPEKPFYVLGVMAHRPWYKLNTSDDDQALLKKLISEVEFPGESYVIILNNSSGYYKKLAKIFPKVAGAQIYRR